MEDIKKRVTEIIGTASVCWSSTPVGVFEEERALELVDEIMEIIKNETTKQ